METTDLSKKIQLLPEHIIDQIKAGEVIERPSTLLKEIIENSIDAGSTKIDLHLVDNGLELVSLIDNGKGIPAKDLPLAFCRHATSKIDRFEDIYRLHSYGFRGEALASIASISKVTCESNTADTEGIIKIEGGLTTLHQEDKSQTKHTGTKLFIRELFYNTPVRMKFIQSKTSEKNQLKKIINAFLLTHPDIEFFIKWDEKEKEHYGIKENLEDRIKDVLFRGKDVNFHIAENSYDGVHFKSFITKESSRGNAHKQHYLFINERYVQDIQIHKITLNSSKDLWPEGETGSYISFIDIPADEVDVNIHPNKTVVKLFRAPKVFSVISGAIKHSLAIQIERPSSAFNQPNQQLSLENTMDNKESNLEYKQIDFSQQDVVETYFEDLHKPENRIHQAENFNIINSDQFSLINISSQYYILNKNLLLTNKLRSIILKADLKESSVPLLVSRPIKIDKKLNKGQLLLFHELGYEIDHLDTKTLVIRSFPNQLQQYPYIQLVEYIVQNGFIDKKDIDLKKFTFEPMGQTIIEELVNNMPLTELLENKTIVRFNQEDLELIYEKKK